MNTYDFSRVMTVNDEPVTDDKENKMTARDMTIRFLRLRDGQEKPTEESVNLSRKIIKKLKAAEDLTAVPLKNAAVAAIKGAFLKWAGSIDLVHQIHEIFDGECTQAQLDDI